MLLITYKKIKNTDGVYKKSYAPFSAPILGISHDEFDQAKAHYLNYKQILLDIGCDLDAFFDALEAELKKPKTSFNPAELKKALDSIFSFIEAVSTTPAPKDLAPLLIDLETFQNKLSNINADLQYKNSLMIPFIKYALITFAVITTIVSILTFFVLPGLTGMLVSIGTTVLSGLAIYLPPKLPFYTNLATRATTKCAENSIKIALQNTLASTQEKIHSLKDDISLLKVHTKNAARRSQAIASLPVYTLNASDDTYLQAHKKICELNHCLKTAKEADKATDIIEKYRPLLQESTPLDEKKGLADENITALREARQKQMNEMQGLAAETLLSKSSSSIFKRFPHFTYSPNDPATYKPWKQR